MINKLEKKPSLHKYFLGTFRAFENKTGEQTIGFEPSFWSQNEE